MEDTYINLGTRFTLNRIKKELVDIETGEIYSNQDEIIDILLQLRKDKEFNQYMERSVREVFELPTALELYQQRWKDDSWFIKIYRTEMREYKKITRLSSSAGLLLFYMQDYIEYRTNKIVNTNGKAFTNKELATLSNLSEKTIIKVLNELEDKNFIRRMGKSRARAIYFNPYLASAGNEMDKSLLDMFDDYCPVTPY